MNEQFTTIKVWLKTRRLLRQIAATTDETMVEAIERLAQAEWARLATKTDRVHHQPDEKYIAAQKGL